MSVQLSELTLGCKVRVRGDFGSGHAVTGVVTEIEEDIKNGRPGISYEFRGEGSWAYLTQVDSVIG